MSNVMIGHRRAGIHYVYDKNGQFDQERWSKVDKRYWRRWLKIEGKKELQSITQDTLSP